MKPTQLLLGHMLVPVKIPRRLFYWATDPEGDIYVQFGNWTYLAMWKAQLNLTPIVPGFTRPRAEMQAIYDAHAERMQKEFGATDAELQGIGDTVEFVVTVPRGLVGTAWTDDDYYDVGRLAIASVKYSWHVLDEVYKMEANYHHQAWMAEWGLDVESSIKLAEAEELLAGL